MASQVFTYILLFHFHLYIIHAHQFKSIHKIPSPLKFLNQLSGVQKGDNVKYVSDLKKYLSYLGYLIYNTNSNEQRSEKDNIFDSSVELALKKYQKFYNLNITGTLDANTMVKMQEPRCGMPDFYRPDKSAVFPFHMISYYSFFPGHPKWRKKKLKYAFNRNMKEELKPPLEHALSEWASATPFRFSRVSNLSQADIKISFFRGYHGDGQPFGSKDAGLAHTFAPPDGRVHFDAAQKWSSKGEKDAYDVQTVGLHELGHALGLGHTRILKAVMYPIVHEGERKGLHEDDINGIKALYKF
ncbi:metalloendoproteinase 5-MMP-like [Sesamum indicum]|uniref:Metalloendoproteinase 5-MMP-like n=1 Tax=Sesamum indicum TaxID=4182 RepID=A0A6I9TMY9_SESIN|nr:metalloendoproteinase 5-MMP-like [Sesamum indicum]